MAARIGFLVFEGFQLLHASGPIAAFEIAGRYRPGAYALTPLAKAAGPVASSSRVSMNAIVERAPVLDMLVVAGGDGTRRALRDPDILRFVRAAAAKAPLHARPRAGHPGELAIRRRNPSDDFSFASSDFRVVNIPRQSRGL